MNRKYFFTTGLAIALLCVTSGFVPVYAQGNQAPDFSVLKLAQAYNAGKIELTQEEITAIRTEAFLVLGDALEKIGKLGVSAEDIQKYLPKNLANILANVISISKQNISAEEKVSALVKIYDSNCQSYLVTWIAIYLGNIIAGVFLTLITIPVIGPLIIQIIGLASTIFFWATVLCYLGVI